MLNIAIVGKGAEDLGPWTMDLGLRFEDLSQGKRICGRVGGFGLRIGGFGLGIEDLGPGYEDLGPGGEIWARVRGFGPRVR